MKAANGQQTGPGSKRVRTISQIVLTRFPRVPDHSVRVVRAKTLDLVCFPRSDFLFVDGVHVAPWIAHDAGLVRGCLNERGVAAFHDYDCPIWPDVKPAVDARFPKVEAFETVAVYRDQAGRRQEYAWPDVRQAT